jgi:gamma-butyrobetaine dioxygenase
MTAPAVGRLCASPDLVTIEWANGGVAEFAGIWLRDNMAADRDAHSGQRLIDVADLPARPGIRSATIAEGSLRIEWQDDDEPASFDLGWLAAHSTGAVSDHPERATNTWLNGIDLQPAWAAFAEVRRDPALRLDWLTRLLQDGIAFMSALPAADGAIRDAADLVGRICETNYGRVFDVRSVPQPDNLAYSDLGLGLHTDNPYRDPVPGFQALHALRAAADGGDSLFADGFALAKHLNELDTAAFDTLARTPVPFRYRARDADLYAERPLIQLSCGGETAAIHYNSRSIAPLRSSGRGAEIFYAAYRRFALLLRDRRHHLVVRLQDGDLAVFDNQRILHGRTAFSAARHVRHLRGCYLTRDSVYSQTALLRRRGS